MQHFLSILSTPAEQIRRYLDRAFELYGKQTDVLAGTTLAILFEKPSLRTRVSFEEAMNRLGGRAIVLGQNEVGLGSREAVEDVSRVLSGMSHGMCLRVFDHENLLKMSKVSTVPVINALSDLSHPAQVLADVMTLAQEFGDNKLEPLKGRTVTFIGDGNNVSRSLAVICGKLGMKFRISSPAGYSLTDEWIDHVRKRLPELDLDTAEDPEAFLEDADALYSDTFVSMGEEAERAIKMAAFEGYQVNEEMMVKCPKHCIVLHCLPAYRGIEITDAVIDGPQSRVFQQAHNRLHAQIGLLAEILKDA
jgi:ornithine carbamoyltransferase